MKTKSLSGLFMLCMALILVSCQFKSFEVMKDGVLIRLKSKDNSGASEMKVQVITDRVIHITAIPGKSFSKGKSLMAVENKLTLPKFTCKQEGNELFLRTSCLNVKIDLNTGAVCYTDTTSKVILAEKQVGVKSFSPVTLENEKCVSVRQVFESPDDEAIYGLGENQTSILNLKGKDADLFQYNTVAVVPFIVSDRNYGILWYNNSRTKFGDTREFEELSSMKIYDKSGNTGGLTATYKLKSDTTKAVITRVEKEY